MLQTIIYVFQAKKGKLKGEDVAHDVSFGVVEGVFVTSFILLGLLAGLLLWLGFRFDSGFLRFFGWLFTIVLGIDVVVYVKVKNFFKRMTKRAVDYGKAEYTKHTSRIIDTESE